MIDKSKSTDVYALLEKNWKTGMSPEEVLATLLITAAVTGTVIKKNGLTAEEPLKKFDDVVPAFVDEVLKDVSSLRTLMEALEIVKTAAPEIYREVMLSLKNSVGKKEVEFYDDSGEDFASVQARKAFFYLRLGRPYSKGAIPLPNGSSRVEVLPRITPPPPTIPEAQPTELEPEELLPAPPIPITALQ